MMHKLQQQKLLADELGPLKTIPAFYAKIDTSGDCWIWTASKSKRGYGACSLSYGSNKAHRVAYMLAFGPINKGNVICHICDNPSCVRPNHLVQGSQKENSHDAWSKGRGVQQSLEGEKNPAAKLTPVVIDEMKRLRATGMFYWKIAKQFGVSTTCAWQAIKGERWSHLQQSKLVTKPGTVR